MKELILAVLEFAKGLAPEAWRPFAGILINEFRQSGWLEDSEQWGDAAKVVTRWLRDVMAARGIADGDLARQARLAAELTATRELKRLNLLQGV
jgi:hypothetical protein